MELPNQENEMSKMLNGQVHILNQSLKFINSMSLKCAMQLNIPEIIKNHCAPMRLSELVLALGINKSKANCLFRLMRILINSGYFISQKISENEQGYVVAPSASFHSTKDASLIRIDVSLVAPVLQPAFVKPWDYLSKWFLNEEFCDVTPFEMAFQMSYWEYLRKEENAGRHFNESVAIDARLIGGVMIKECREIFEEIESVVDVGGGTGTASMIIADAFPNLRCINFDLPHVVDGLTSSENLVHVAGDMFQAVPPANVALLKWILHDWNDEECVKILKRCKEAVESSKEKGGRVMIIETVVNADEKQKQVDEETRETQLLLDMLMMVLVGGKERDEKEWGQLFADAGFTRYKITPIFGFRSLIQLYP
ncbi:hypothetical protein ACET3Z_025268 [Daucus carota]